MTICRRMHLKSLPQGAFIIMGPEQWTTGDGPIQLSSRGRLPDGLAKGIDYWVIEVGAMHSLATSIENAEMEIPVKLGPNFGDDVPLWAILP